MNATKHLFRFETCPATGLRSVAEVIMHMEKLQEELADTELENVRAFNQTYLIITRNVAAKFGTGYFNDEAQLERFDIRFAEYYFQALKDHCDGGSVPAAWEVLFECCRGSGYFQFSFMALGVNAHVNNDLAQALRDAAPHGADEEDYLRVNQVIRSSLAEVAWLLKEESPAVTMLKDRLRNLYGLFLNRLIAKWRASAWVHYQALLSGSTEVPVIENGAAVTAHRLASARNLPAMGRFVSRELLSK